MDILSEKPFPESYDPRAVAIVRAMSFGEPNIVGSMSLKSQQFASDYDMIEEVPIRSIAGFVKMLQEKIQTLLRMPHTWVADFKAGIVPAWVLIPDTSYVEGKAIKGFKKQEAMKRLEGMRGVLSAEEWREAKDLLEHITPSNFFETRKQLRYHIVRWTPLEILSGSVQLRDGRILTLADALQQPSIVKLDVVGYVDSFTDFSIIYTLTKGGKPIAPVPMLDFELSLEQDILAYQKTDPFKAMKRMFSLAKFRDDTELLEALQPILNGDLGRLYSIVGDANTILYLLENENNLPFEKIQEEFGEFKERLGNIYTFLVPDSVFHQISKMDTMEDIRTLRPALERFLSDTSALLNKEARPYFQAL